LVNYFNLKVKKNYHWHWECSIIYIAHPLVHLFVHQTHFQQ